jgi:cytochrome c biogenesis protein CcdA
MASGVGSASMNAASLGPTLAAFPALETQIEAFAGFSNLLSFSIGIYIVIFLALPLTEKLYEFLEPKIGRNVPNDGSADANQEGGK